MLRIKLSALLATSIHNFPVKNANPILHIAPKKTPFDEFLHCPNGVLGSHLQGLQRRSYSSLLALNNMSDNKGSRQHKTQKGRSSGSGKGKTAGRGHKGQKARETHKFGFEGGQTPLCRRVPKRLVTNPCSLTFQPVGLGKIATLINCGKIDTGRTRSPTVTHPVVRFPSFSSRGLPELKCSSRSSAYQVSSSLGSTRSFSVTSSSWTLDSLKTNSPKGVFGLVPINGGAGELHSSVRSELVEIIKHGNKDMEYKLNLAGSLRRIGTITEIFRVLNHQKISGLRFFRWLRHNNPKWHSSAKVCSLIVCNCGCLGDFETMRHLLLEFRNERICLDETAFSFLSLFTPSNDLMDSVRRVLSLLDEVGGSCRNSGISALIEMFCNRYMFDMAKFVIEITGRNNMHYNILLRHRCKRGHHEEARGIIKEMRRPTIKSYNYLLGSLCKNILIDEACILVEEMEENGVHPDEITFEILIINSCITGKLDIAKQLLNKMTENRLLPRLSTHSAILKAFFKAEQYEESHNYVMDSSIKCQQSGPGVYSLLAGLHLGKEHLAEAQDILIQMMNMDLRPNFRVYVKTLKQLQKTGRKDMVQDLENRYNSFFKYFE